MIFTVIEFNARLPETLWGWVAVVSGIAALLISLLTLVIRTGRGHIDRKIQVDMKDVKAEIKESIDGAIQPLADDIRSFGEGRIEFGQRLTSLETTINNGLTSRANQTASDVDEIKVQVAEMYGMMKAHFNWDGATERRT